MSEASSAMMAATTAAAAGLECRPLSETVRDTWAWMTADDEKSPSHERAGEIGLGLAKVQQILAAVS